MSKCLPVDYLIYGKIIIDRVHLASGEIRSELLGGGGPQALFGARLWSDSVGFLSRSGTDISPQHVEQLQSLGADLAGWARYPDLKTIYGQLMAYDENELSVVTDEHSLQIAASDNWRTMLGRPLSLPDHFQQPQAIHLITEYFAEPMVTTARQLRRQGTVFSLEPIIDFRQWSNRAELLSLLPGVDIVTPDWPSASGIAGSQDPRAVLHHWSQLGAAVVAIRHGPNGSYVWDRFTQEMWHIPIMPVTSIDPTGAGNSYGAAFCIGWVEHKSAKVAGGYGTIAASLVVQAVGLPHGLAHAAKAAAKEKIDWLLSQVRPL